MSLDGRAPDEGTCGELGMAYALGKRYYGLKMDTRMADVGMDLNLMISGCTTKIFKNYNGDTLMEEIKEYGGNNKLQEW